MDVDGIEGSDGGLVLQGWLTPDTPVHSVDPDEPTDRELTASGQVSGLGSIRLIWSPVGGGGAWAALIDDDGNSVYGSGSGMDPQASIEILGGTGRLIGAGGWILVSGMSGRASWTVEGELSVGDAPTPPGHHRPTTRRREPHGEPVEGR